MEENNVNEAAEEEPQPQPKRKSKLWLPHKTFENTTRFQSFLRKEQCWKITNTLDIAGGTKTFYYCNKSGVGRNRCPAQLSAYKPSTTSTIILESSGGHVHQDNHPKISAKVYKKIKEYVKIGMKPRVISHEIRTNPKYLVKPTKNQVSLVYNSIFGIIW